MQLKFIANVGFPESTSKSTNKTHAQEENEYLEKGNKNRFYAKQIVSTKLDTVRLVSATPSAVHEK